MALELLPESLASDPEQLVRLERRARLLASLNHSNNAQVTESRDTTEDDIWLLPPGGKPRPSRPQARGPAPVPAAR